jgi:hypothetical protein
LINLIGPDGKPWELDNDDPAALDEAFRQGFKRPVDPVSKSGLETAGETGAAGVLGAVEGLTGGLSDVVMGLAARPDRSGFVDPAARAGIREARKLKEEHPVARGAGELVGSFVPWGAATAAIEGPRAATALGRVAQKTLGGAATGALYGAGSTLGDTALQDSPQLTAEKLVASAGLGALLGGAGSGIFGALEEGAGAALSKLGGVKANKTLEDFANDRAVAATRATQKAVDKLGDARVNEVGQMLRERGHLSTPDRMLESLGADIEKTGALKGSFLDAADAGAVKPNWNEASKALDEYEAALSPLQREEAASHLSKARTALEDIATDPKRGTWRDFDQWKRDLQSKASYSRGAVEDNLALDLKRNLAGKAREELDRQLVPALGNQGEAFLESKRVYGLLKDAEKLAKSGAGRGEGIHMKDLLLGGILGGGHPGGLAAAIGAKFMREHGPAVVAKLADAIAKSPALAATAASFSKAVPEVASRVGPYGETLMQAAARSPAVALATHMTMAHVDPSYAATAQMAGLEPESPEQHDAAIARAGNLAAVGATAHDVDGAIDRHIDQALKGTRAPTSPSRALAKQDFGAMRMRREASDAHDKRTEEIRQLAGDPNALLDRLSKNLEKLGPVAPGVSAALTSQANVAVQYLAKAAERPLKPGPLARDWVPTETERHEFTQKLEAVQDPMSVLKHAAAGTLTQNQVDALKAVYPGLAKAVGEKALMRAMAAKPGEVPYRARLMLSMLTGVDLDGSTSQAVLASNQLANRGNKQSQENAAPQSSGARSEMTLASRMALPSQRRELESE